MNEDFADTLTRLRRAAGLTNVKLSERAAVPCSLIAGLQSGKRRVGELQARRIGQALGLKGGELDAFIFHAINQCTEKVLSVSRGYPAELLNRLALLLRKAGILPDQVHGCQVIGDDLALKLADGQQFKLETKLAAV